MQPYKHVRHQTPPGSDIHGLGLRAETPLRQSVPSKQLREGEMPYLLPRRVQQLSPTTVVRRKELPADSSSLVPTRASSLKNRKSRRIGAGSTDNPTLSQIEESAADTPMSGDSDFDFVPRNLDLFPHLGHTPQLPQSFDNGPEPRNRTPGLLSPFATPSQTAGPPPSRPGLQRDATSYHTARSMSSEGSIQSEHSISLASRPRLQVDGRNSSASHEAEAVELASFSKASDNHDGDLVTRRAVSKASYGTASSNGDSQAGGASRSVSDILGQYDHTDGTTSLGSRNSLSQHASQLQGLVDDLREELRAVGVELATSIQREMDLEDEVERLVAERGSGTNDRERRTSDYFSESSTSSARLSAHSETRIQSLEKMRRKAEQEKAQMRRDMAKKLEEDMIQKRAFELHRQSLEDQLRSGQGVKTDTDALMQKARDLEFSLEDTRRHLHDERQVRENIEELLKGLQLELGNKNEREVDEVVPQLRARIDGLEEEAAQMQQLTYENARLEQEMKALKSENQALVTARQLDMDIRPRANSRNEEGPMSPRAQSTTVARSTSTVRRGGARPNSVVFDSPIIENPQESLKDVEEQRNALQKTLQSLVLRFEHESKENARRLRAAEKERDRGLRRHPQKSLASRVHHWRSEYDRCRRDANEVLERKWQCEKGLSGLTMDLARAQQDTQSLHVLLQSMEGDEHGSDYANIAAQLRGAIRSGEHGQQAASAKIVELQQSLKTAEERIFAAQTDSEEALNQHEETARVLRETRADTTRRGVRRSSTVDAMTSPNLGSATRQSTTDPPLRPFRITAAPSPDATDPADPMKVNSLQEALKDLDNEVERAEKEIHDIVETMRTAQAGAAALQSQSDELAKERRKQIPTHFSATKRP